MSKKAKSFRLSAEALDHLDAVQSLTGSTQAAIIEQALALYRRLYDRDCNFVQNIVAAPSVKDSK